MWYLAIMFGKGINYAFLKLRYFKKGIKMARPKGKGHRVALTLNQETNEVFDRFASLSGVPKATLIRDYIEHILPTVKMSVDTLEKLKNAEMTPVQAQGTFLNFLADYNDTFSNAIREIAKPLDGDLNDAATSRKSD